MKRTVAKVKNKVFQDLYKCLETKEGVNKVFQIAKHRGTKIDKMCSK